MHSLPLFVKLAGRPVILVGEGPAADAKRRLLERADAVIVGQDAAAALAIVADGDEAAVARLKARGLLVNAVDRPDLCDFTLPAIVDRDPVLVAIGTGGVSAGLAAALRQRLEALLPAGLGSLATALSGAREALRARFPEARDRRQAIGTLLAPGGALDPLGDHHDPVAALRSLPSPFPGVGRGPGEASAAPEALDPGLRRGTESGSSIEHVAVTSPDPDELTLRAARLLGQADAVYHPADMPAAILDRARADAERIAGPPPLSPPPGLTIVLDWKLA